MSTIGLRPGQVPLTRRQRRESLAGVTIDSAESYSGDFPIEPTVPLTREHLTRHQLRYIVNSPYNEIEHRLDLSTLDTPHRLFAQALTVFEPATSAYTTTPYSECFNWSDIVTALRALSLAESVQFPRTEFYVIEFRSRLKEKYDHDRLFMLDKESHREAAQSGGLLKYWYGSADSQRRGLATCVWRGKADAIAGGMGMYHKQARQITAKAYESVNVTGLRLTIEEGARDWKFEPWEFHRV